jgi:GH15 family glucan-1,4-alpha-glucosidase
MELPGYLPIADHGLIGDLGSAALVGSDGTIDWYCCGRFDAPSVFAAILDRRRGGFWRLAPAGKGWIARQLYLPETNVLITRFIGGEGVVEVQDFMPVGGRPQRLIRSASCVKGRVMLEVGVEPRFDYARADHQLELTADGAVFESPALRLSLSSAVPMKPTSRGVRAGFELTAGESASFVLEPDGAPHRLAEDEVRAQRDATAAFWRSWLARSRYVGRWREMVHRSALTLKLLTCESTGALVAAPTASLPEQLGGPRNWDYRYTWIRDAAFTLFALLRLGFTGEAGAFMSWLTDRFGERSHAPGPLQIAYGIDGRAELPEVELSHLEGYCGSVPVRVGNGAAAQLQLDIYGELMDSVYLYNKYGAPISYDAWMEVVRIVEWLAENWDQEDEGIWETRGGASHFTYSRVMSWVAVERAIRIARQRGLPADLVGWHDVRDRIHHQIMDRGWHPGRGAFVQRYGSEVLDASVLVMPLVKFVAPDDPRWLSTLDAIGRELVSDSLVYRYNPEASPDGLRGNEGTFSMCSFWYVEALARAGRLDEARLVFEKMLTYANHLGLYSEEIGPAGEQLGNFPQAFTHLALISAAFTLDRLL